MLTILAGMGCTGAICRSQGQAHDVLFGRRLGFQVAAASNAPGDVPGEAQLILEFWFADPSKMFQKDPVFDIEIKKRFAGTIAKAKAGELQSWEQTADGCLALVILLDQMPRNIFRGDAAAFATDLEALRICKEAIRQGFDEGLSSLQRHMLYMPFMHSESLAVQEEGMTYFAALGNEQTLSYAKRHLEDIRKYGRFPGRNAALGRENTPEEVQYIQAGGGY